MKIYQVTILTAVLGLILLPGCYYDKIPAVKGVDYEVSFSADVIPIFDRSCNMTGCHNSGGIKPDLTVAKAYDELNNGGYLNTESPEQSELYERLIGTQPVMPPAGKLPDSEISVILGWMEQGALNN